MKSVRIKDIVIGEGIVKICVPIMGRTIAELLEEIRAIQNTPADIIEWRIDYFNEVDNIISLIEAARTIQENVNKQILLATFRSKKEGGVKEIPFAYYETLLDEIITSKTMDMIDLELSYPRNRLNALIQKAHEHHVFVIMSSHDFEKTPDYEELIHRMKCMRMLNADILKIAVMPKDANDVLTLLKATNDLHNSHIDRPMITMAMGNLGMITRLSGEVFGSAVTFGCLKSASAPGQIQVTKLHEILTLLHRDKI